MNIIADWRFTNSNNVVVVVTPLSLWRLVGLGTLIINSFKRVKITIKWTFSHLFSLFPCFNNDLVSCNLQRIYSRARNNVLILTQHKHMVWVIALTADTILCWLMNRLCCLYFIICLQKMNNQYTLNLCCIWLSFKQTELGRLMCRLYIWTVTDVSNT